MVFYALYYLTLGEETKMSVGFDAFQQYFYRF